MSTVLSLVKRPMKKICLFSPTFFSTWTNRSELWLLKISNPTESNSELVNSNHTRLKGQATESGNYALIHGGNMDECIFWRALIFKRWPKVYVNVYNVSSQWWWCCWSLVLKIINICDHLIIIIKALSWVCWVNSIQCRIQSLFFFMPFPIWP